MDIKFSDDQEKIIKSLKNYSVIVNSVAGSGKTTTALGIAKYYFNNKILLLTYNSRLKDETREKVIKYNLKNMEVHSYHAFCYKYYERFTTDDSKIKKIIDNNTKPIKEINFDIIIIDEAQDITLLYYELICKIVTENKNKKAKLCLIGDIHQTIFEFNGADDRFLLHSKKLFNFHNKKLFNFHNKKLFNFHNKQNNKLDNKQNNEFDKELNNKQNNKLDNKQNNELNDKQNKELDKELNDKQNNELIDDEENKWKIHKLTESFRVPREITEFINKCVIDENRIESNKIMNEKPRYLYCNTYYSKKHSLIFDEVKLYLQYYLPQDIFILAPSIRNKTPVISLENVIKRKLDIPIYVSVNDDDKLDNDIIKNKLVISSIHQVKGLERKVVILFSFDSSYFKFYKKGTDPNKCTNDLYVALTRPLERLSIIHCCNYEPLNFVHDINKYCNIIIEEDINTDKLYEHKIQSSDNATSFKKKKGVTELIKFLPYEIVDTCMELITKKDITKKDNPIKININDTINDIYGKEKVSDITGIAIPSYYEFLQKGKIGIFEKIKRTKKNKELKELLKNINYSNIDEKNILKIANCWNSYVSGYIYRLDQITEYNWLSIENLKKCMKRLNILKISNKGIFEKKVQLEYEDELKEYLITGFIDLVDAANDNNDDNNGINKKYNIFEFKCTQKLQNIHYVQLCLYMYLNEINILNDESIKHIEPGDTIIYYLKKNKISHHYSTILEHLEDYKQAKVIGKNINNDLIIEILNNEMKNNEMKNNEKKNNEIKNNNIIINKNGQFCLYKNISWIKRNEDKWNITNKYFLYNILTREIVRIKSTIHNLRTIIKIIIEYKNDQHYKQDKEFIKNCVDTLYKYVYLEPTEKNNIVINGCSNNYSYHNNDNINIVYENTDNFNVNKVNKVRKVSDDFII